MFLLDTNVISELRRSRPHGAVVGWISKVAAGDLHISAVTVGELQAGVEVTREQDPEKAHEIEQWVDSVAASYSVIPMDVLTFRYWARFMHRRANSLNEDAMIAATAQVHNLTVVTRNLRDFKLFGVKTLDPFR
jgi:predicted nucleic acid-binding protein